LSRELPLMRQISRVLGRPQLYTHVSHGKLFCLSELTGYSIVQCLANISRKCFMQCKRLTSLESYVEPRAYDPFPLKSHNVAVCVADFIQRSKQAARLEIGRKARRADGLCVQRAHVEQSPSMKGRYWR
jgi:hypothetical protein